jgi:hypothetical protein
MEPLRICIFSPRPVPGPGDLKPFFDNLTSDAGWFRKATWIGFTNQGRTFRLVLGGEDYWREQRAGLKGYAATFLDPHHADFRDFSQRVDRFASMLSLLGEHEITQDDEVFQRMDHCARMLRGVLFAWEHIIIPGQGVLFGPSAAKPAPADTGTDPVRRTATEAQLQGTVRTSLDHPQPTPRQLNRRKQSGETIRALGLPVLDGLPVLEDEDDAETRSVPATVRRLLCVLICAVKAESEDDEELTRSLIAQYRIGEWFSPEERAYVAKCPATDAERAKFGWRYECAHVLAWWLGYLDELPPANTQADPGAIVRAVKDRGVDELIALAKPRPLSVLLDAVDLTYRLHWAAIELRLKGRTHAAVNEEIIMERHYALNWLICYQDAEWDDVPTDT